VLDISAAMDKDKAGTKCGFAAYDVLHSIRCHFFPGLRLYCTGDTLTGYSLR